MSSLTAQGIKLVVFDMAGTVVDEGGVVYVTLKKALRDGGLSFTEEQFDKFHGANKKEAIAHFVNLAQLPNADEVTELIFKNFTTAIEEAYFGPTSTVKPIPGVIKFFEELNAAGIKVALDTGYPRSIAGHLITTLGFTDYIHASTVAEEVGFGRPYPYMIHDIMRKLQIQDVRSVAKVGDTALDMQEGKNAGCVAVYGVLTGADNAETLHKNGASAVVNTVTDIPI